MSRQKSFNAMTFTLIAFFMAVAILGWIGLVLFISALVVYTIVCVAPAQAQSEQNDIHDHLHRPRSIHALPGSRMHRRIPHRHAVYDRLEKVR